MNEKKLSKEWDKALLIEGDEKDSLKYRDYGCDGADECCGNCGGARLLEDKVFDWFINRIKERDEQLKEAIVTMITDAMEEDHKCGGGCGICQWAESVREQILEPVVNLIDNHA